MKKEYPKRQCRLEIKDGLTLRKTTTWFSEKIAKIGNNAKCNNKSWEIVWVSKIRMLEKEDYILYY